MRRSFSWALAVFLFSFWTSNGVAGGFVSDWKLPQMKERLFDETSTALLASGALGAGLSSSGDFSIRDQWAHHQQMSVDVEKFGDVLGTGLPGLAIAFFQLQFDEGAGRDHLRALVGTTLATYSLKTVTHRRRPGQSENYQSFPSGHTSTMFATATALTMSYGPRAAVLFYPLAIMTGMSRLASDSHWTSDVVAGAVIGTWIGRAASLEATRVTKKDKDSMHVLPWIDSEFRGIQFAWSRP